MALTQEQFIYDKGNVDKLANNIRGMCDFLPPATVAVIVGDEADKMFINSFLKGLSPNDNDSKSIRQGYVMLEKSSIMVIPLHEIEKIRGRRFKIVYDTVGRGDISIPALEDGAYAHINWELKYG